MKNTAILPALFLFYFIIFLAAFSVLSLFQSTALSQTETAGSVLGLIPASVRQVFPGAVIQVLKVGGRGERRP